GGTGSTRACGVRENGSTWPCRPRRLCRPCCFCRLRWFGMVGAPGGAESARILVHALQRPGERQTPPRAPTFDRARCNAQRSGGLGDRELFDVDEIDRRALVLR